MSTALIMIDIQNDYFSGGCLPLVEMEPAADRVAAVLERFRAAARPLFHVQHVSVRTDATFFRPGTDGVALNARVAPQVEEPIVTKHFPNAFRDTKLDQALKAASVTDLVICGAMSHMCIDASTRAAFDLGYACTVLSDACATRDLMFEGETIPAAHVHAAFMSALQVPYARVVRSDEFLSATI